LIFITFVFLFEQLQKNQFMSFKENIRIDTPSAKVMLMVDEIFHYCPPLKEIMNSAVYFDEAMISIEKMFAQEIDANKSVQYFLKNTTDESAFADLDWADFALIRLWDYVKFSQQEFAFYGEAGGKAYNHPFEILWRTFRQKEHVATEDFFIDMLELFKQWRDQSHRPQKDIQQLEKWMNRHYSGLDADVQEQRLKNKKRIIKVLAREISNNPKPSAKYSFEQDDLLSDKLKKVERWWDDYHFHLKYAIRKPGLLNEMLDFSLSTKTMELFAMAQKKGIPFFVNPYYLSLILVNPPEEMKNADQTLRDYIFYSQDLVEEFGKISAWEKEDVVEEGKPNAAGWLLPNDHNIHRRYPEVAIFIPDSMGRACGGLCVSCQRMYDFQRGNLNFNLDKLKPKESWDEKLQKLMQYFEFDSHLKDILITGGDSLMSSSKTINKILNAVYQMAIRKKEANKNRPDGEKFAEMQRIRLGTRLPVYLPQRIDDKLIAVLANFKEKAVKIGFQEFVVQVHFESPMEITTEATIAIQKLNSSGWLIVNQQVFTTAASRRGYASKLRLMLNKIGVIPYYTFSVKGFKENRHNFATNARAAQEMAEEKSFGKVSHDLNLSAHLIKSKEANDHVLKRIIAKEGIPFLATDRSVFNMPALGKSMSFRVIGITADGRRILMFDYDHTRKHSPVIHAKDKVILIESKSVTSYLKQLESMGENIDDYQGIYGYSLCLTESRSEVFEYPKSRIKTTTHFSNLGR
jgi:lysine 2,3-aminomutase